MSAQHIYMIGVGGMGMGPLAMYLAGCGHCVTGSDDCLKPDVATFLEKSGVNIDKTGVLPEECDLVVYSSAIGEGHYIYEAAQKRGIRMVRRGEYLAEVLEQKKVVAIVGSHGKTTTCGLLIEALRASGFDFGYLLGAYFQGDQLPPAYYSESEWVVLEVDESDGTIAGFNPEYTLVVNFDWDHQAQYKTIEDLQEVFHQLFKRTKTAIVVPEGYHHLDSIVGDLACTVLRIGEGTDYYGKLVEGELVLEGVFNSEKVRLSNGAGFSLQNVLAALVGVHLLTGEVGGGVFDEFKGVRRRQEWLWRGETLKVMMDYAHHPVEVEVLLNYIKSTECGRIVVVFQPHRYTRTRQYYKEFAEVLDTVDKAYLLPVYAASEQCLEDGSSERILNASTGEGSIECLPYDVNRIMTVLPDSASDAETTVLFVGAGDIEELAVSYGEFLAKDAWWKELTSRVSEETKMRVHEPLAKKTTLRVGGNAWFYAEPASIDDLVLLIRESKRVGCPLFPLGRGSNLVVPDEGFKGLVIKLNHKNWQELEDLGDGRLYAGAGVSLKKVCGTASKMKLAGFEFLEGIPGSVGGSLRMNAGAMGGWLFDVVESIKRVTLEGEVEELTTQELTLGYRHCTDLQDSIAVGAVLKGHAADISEDISEKMRKFSSSRKESQPREPSAGCIFKNPEGNYAGKLIENAGLMGERVGGAEVSKVHANFIINRDKATSKDLVGLVKVIRSRVHECSGIDLEPEVLFLGRDWQNELA